MIDIETFGNKSHSVILSIAAVQFDLETGETGKTFYRKIDLQSAIDAGLKLNASTLQWWMEQKHEALIELFSGENRTLSESLGDFKTFYGLINQSIEEDLRVWGNGARFDLGLLEDAYETIGEDAPWNFRAEMDVRTLVAFAPEIKKEMKFEGIEHNPHDDCMHQIKYCSKTWNKLTQHETV